MTTASPARPALLTIGGLIALGLTIGFAIHIGGWTIGRVHHDEHRVVPGPISSLQVDAGSGDVQIVAGSGRDVTIDSRAEGAFHVPKLRLDIRGTHVGVSGGCDDVTLGPCRTTITMHVPPDVRVSVDGGSADLTAIGMTAPVRLHTASGDVTADGLTGGADLQTASGDVGASRLAGPVSLKSSSGDVSGADLDARHVTASTNSGDVSLTFATAPDRVQVLGHSGDMNVVVPPGSGPYDVVTSTNSGSTNAFPGSRDARRSIEVRTNSGDINLAMG
jgi:hypothetical protein